MKKYILSFFLFMPFYLWAQEWRFTLRGGFVTGETRVVKKMMFISEWQVCHEQLFARNWYWGIGIGQAILKYDQQDRTTASSFHKVSFLTLPIYLKKVTPVTRKVMGYVEAGFLGDYCIREKIEIKNISANETVKYRWPGYNLSGFCYFGIRTHVNNGIYVDVNLGSRVSLLSHYSDASRKLTVNSTTIGLSLYKKF